MDKKQNNKSIWIISLLLILIVMLSTIWIYMPKRYCHTTEKVIKVELPHWDGWTEGDYFYNKDDIVLCEDGVNIYENSRKLVNFKMDMDLVCLIKTKERKCEIK